MASRENHDFMLSCCSARSLQGVCPSHRESIRRICLSLYLFLLPRSAACIVFMLIHLVHRPRTQSIRRILAKVWQRRYESERL